MLRKISGVKIWVFSLLLMAQNYRSQDFSFFPEPIKTSAEYYNKGEFGKAMAFNVEVLKKYETLKDKEGISAAYTNIASLLFSVGKLKESMQYLDNAKAEISKDNALSQTRFYGEYARIYTKLGLVEQSNDYFDKALRYAGKINDPNQQKFCVLYIYLWKRLNYLNQEDSLRAIEKKLIKVMPSAITYSKIADRFIEKKKQLDSADYYLTKATQTPDYAIVPVQGIVQFSYGNLFNAKKEYKNALDAYQQSLSAFQKTKYRTQIRNVYDSIASTYHYLDDPKMANEYLKKYKAVNDTLKNEEKEAVTIAVNKLLQEEKQDKQKEKKQLYFIFAGCIVLLLLIVSGILRMQRSKQLKKESLLEEQALENLQLKKQLNASADQLIKLAETNSPSFLAQFKETYPDFIERLLSHQEDLSEYDLKLSACIRLGLSTKQIAQYEIIALRTAESRKYRLKKKLKLDSDVSLNKWILEL
ncbi:MULTISPECIES: tetratricopeptide repeat protein [Elizabethkingia]|uniref:tetratricopeptide repeat protein n=1 Tax=Elizabethkingia TaxID=308865 RepID=UPI000999829B|nr:MULTISPECIES: tetratricopeptide repeat protein [Elizabethkingia]EJC8060133.1 tetratricopeptide repeat protein [Elizabethkingia anophelis]MCL1643189.1 tetratricopeptide repeat protein [Elizabethkingia anophelis]MCL1643870.1 tetratricopeptide repeat protein [Elizabethkingia anophelis]MCT3672328.1 tetratricopeptide repeat protein [Elizabethkingia anophelis]MCT3679766.1 tetratricopeptide repeat protein [Elizabethkingia anophelis]